MSKKYTVKNLLKIGLPVLLIIAIITGLAWMGKSQAKESHEISNYATFKEKISKSLLKARKIALKQHIYVIICPYGSEKTACGLNENWGNGFIVYKKLSNLDSHHLPNSAIIYTNRLNISSQVKTKISNIEMQPNGTLPKQYQFIIKSANKGDFPYQLTVKKDLSLNTKLLPNN